MHCLSQLSYSLTFYQVKKRYDNLDRLWIELPTREEPCVDKSKDELDGNSRPHSPTIELEESVCWILHLVFMFFM